MNTRIPSTTGRRFSALLAVTLTLAFSQELRAQSSTICMNFEGIIGGVTTKGFEKTIELSSFQFGVGRALGVPKSDGTRDPAAPPPSSVSEINVIMPFYAPAYAQLLRASLEGTPKTVVISVVQGNDSAGVPRVPIKITLSGTMVSGWSTTAAAGDSGAGFTNVSLNFTKIMVETTGIDPTGASLPPSSVSYNLGTGVAR